MIGAVQWNHLEIRGDCGGGSRPAGAAHALEEHARVKILDVEGRSDLCTGVGYSGLFGARSVVRRLVRGG